jgi:hypothetical protein
MRRNHPSWRPRKILAWLETITIRRPAQRDAREDADREPMP